MSKSEFKKEARYRTKQINIVKINGSISAHSTIQCDYYFTFDEKRNIAKVRLDDSVYEFNTSGSEPLANFIRTTDTIKKEMIYSIKSDGEIEDLLNQEAVQKNWEQFKQNIATYELFENSQQQEIDKIINSGDMEYHSKEILLKNSATNLFNQIVLGQYLTRSFSAFEIEEFATISHFFSQVGFTVSCDTKKVKDSDEQTKYKKIGKPVFVDVDKMIRLYEQLYKEQVGFKFTDYLYDYDMNFTVSKADGLIDYASVTIDERVKNNLQSQVMYELNRVEL